GARGGALRCRAWRDERGDAPVLDLLERGETAAAFDLLVRRDGAAVYALCLRIVKNQARAEEVKQNVFLQAYERISYFSRNSSLRTWLLGIANFRSLDALRALRREASRAAPDDLCLDEVAGDATSPAERAEGDDRCRALGDSLESCLSASDRRLLGLYYGRGLSFEAIGAALGQKPDTVRARVSRALPKLRRHLERRGVAP
ncbi:MAG TPA: sigma-70 family RNA polymerase sigma factor, partial [Polyangiaceae bacterium]|nr:sigma-70 family RNA polymerase sigma factor [Polyangiaceae bacterium]